jgi:hypothetical protein
LTTLAKAKLASSITFIILASFTIVTYDRQNMFIIQATGIVLEVGGVFCNIVVVVKQKLLGELNF